MITSFEKSKWGIECSKTKKIVLLVKVTPCASNFDREHYFSKNFSIFKLFQIFINTYQFSDYPELPKMTPNVRVMTIKNQIKKFGKGTSLYCSKYFTVNF